ncbi:MAG TPA: hypothetical protein VMR52_12665 [Dehalococcoidia bacterium]|nr:hypothetical protein [Dehalococcoidia bacterium]
MDRLASVIAKLDRAKEHLAAFNDEFDAFLALPPYRVVPHPPSPPLEVGEDYVPSFPNLSIGIFRINHEPPMHLNLILGDYIHNVRSALDHLFWQLCLLEDPDTDEFGQFPIFARTDDGSMGRLKGTLKRVHPDAAITLKGMQPHNRRDGFRYAKLWQLARLDNVDKHVTPILTVLREAIVARWRITGARRRGHGKR